MRCRALVLPIAGLVLAAGPLAHAQDSGGGDEARVAALVARYDSAWARRDSAAVGRLLAPRYQYFTSRGGVSTRVETMVFLLAPDYVLEQASRSEVSVSLTGPVAVVSSRWQGRGSYRGERFVDDQRCGQTWARSGRVWQIVSEHCAQIAPPSDVFD